MVCLKSIWCRFYEGEIMKNLWTLTNDGKILVNDANGQPFVFVSRREAREAKRTSKAGRVAKLVPQVKN